jgi:hypothetical protein
MEQITIRVKDKQKARVLKDFLQTLDFVETIASQDRPIARKNRQGNSAAFFTMAGIWAKRDISLETIRKKAWPPRS